MKRLCQCGDALARSYLFEAAGREQIPFPSTDFPYNPAKCLQKPRYLCSGRPGTDVVGILAQHVPDDHCKLARGGDGRDVLPAARGDPLVEGAKTVLRSHSRPCRLDRHPPRMTAAPLRDAPVIG